MEHAHELRPIFTRTDAGNPGAVAWEYQASNPPRYAWACACGHAEWMTHAKAVKRGLALVYSVTSRARTTSAP